MDPWYGLALPANTPQTIIRILTQEVRGILAEPGTREKMLAQVFEPFFEGPDGLRRRMQSELIMWRKVVKDARVKAE